MMCRTVSQTSLNREKLHELGCDLARYGVTFTCDSVAGLSTIRDPSVLLIENLTGAEILLLQKVCGYRTFNNFP